MVNASRMFRYSCCLWHHSIWSSPAYQSPTTGLMVSRVDKNAALTAWTIKSNAVLACEKAESEYCRVGQFEPHLVAS
jgi:hypothetical protein